jgi:hypothetical protein
MLSLRFKFSWSIVGLNRWLASRSIYTSGGAALGLRLQQNSLQLSNHIAQLYSSTTCEQIYS